MDRLPYNAGPRRRRAAIQNPIFAAKIKTHRSTLTVTVNRRFQTFNECMTYVKTLSVFVYFLCRGVRILKIDQKINGGSFYNRLFHSKVSSIQNRRNERIQITHFFLENAKLKKPI